MKKPTSTRPSRTIPFEIPTAWTPKQALAVFNLLDALSHRIWIHYEVHLVNQMMERHRPLLGLPNSDRWLAAAKPNGNSDDDFPDDDIPF
jgi:hypothetical protein